MKIEIKITDQPIAVDRERPQSTGARAACAPGDAGAFVEFCGIVRDLENGQKISALDYEAYSPMAENEIRQILESLAEKHPCLSARVIHRIGAIPVGETAIYVGITAKHRAEAFAMLAGFMDRLKQDVPIWKRGARTAGLPHGANARADTNEPGRRPAVRSLDEALAEISALVLALPGERVPLPDAPGRILRETVVAAEDMPSVDRSTRDGFAILADDLSEKFSIIDTVHAADWKPRQLKPGEAVRIATGGSLPCDGLRVVMQENVERGGDTLRIVRRETALNIRKRGEDLRAGEPVLSPGTPLTAGALALLATVGCSQPLVSPKLRVIHFTTGDEIVPFDQKPGPGQIRDSNSIMICSLLQKYSCEVTHLHLREDFEQARRQISDLRFEISNFDAVLVSGGASVGDKDFTLPLLEWLGFKIVFNRVNIRPGAPLIFGTAGGRVAFGLPGNPLSHFVCFHLFVAAALARMAGAEPQNFSRGVLAAKLEDAANPRETWWPSQGRIEQGVMRLSPLRWSSSGDVTCLAAANALARVPANAGPLEAGAEVEFLPI